MKLKILVCLSLITTIASITRAARAQTFSVIHAFTEPSGVVPVSGVTIKAGVLYGTTICTRYCTGNGTVYQIIPVGANWYFTPISLLSAGGVDPEARVVFGPDNQLYGTTFVGGPQGNGVVFSLTPLVSICKTANCVSTEKVLHLFTDSPDGANPGGGDLIWDAMGNIYGTTLYGGTSSDGTVYQMTKSGND
ncbi:MAG: choice-of-anchor tandem repeat GloVer-containing protein [Candidatus Korobacteraceae bacterium]